MYYNVDKQTLKEKLIELCSNEDNKEICNDTRLYKYYKDDSILEDVCGVISNPGWTMLTNRYIKLLKFIYSIRMYLESIRKHAYNLDCYLVPCISLINIEKYNIKFDDLSCIRFPNKSFVQPGLPNTLKDYLSIMKSLTDSAIINRDRDIGKWIFDTTEKEEFKKFEIFLSDYQPWTTMFVHFLQYYTHHDIPEANKIKDYIDFITVSIYRQNVDFYRTVLKEKTDSLTIDDMIEISKYIMTD